MQRDYYVSYNQRIYKIPSDLKDVLKDLKDGLVSHGIDVPEESQIIWEEYITDVQEWVVIKPELIPACTAKLRVSFEAVNMKEDTIVLKIGNDCSPIDSQPTVSQMTDRKAVVKNADMSDRMQQKAVDCATTAIDKFNIEKDIAAYIKKEFDKKYNPTWHCIVGRNFGSYVTHETKHFIYFYLGQVAILLFKSG